MRFALTLVLFATPLAAQAQTDQLFYRAFWFDRGDRDSRRALELYQRFLDATRPGQALRSEAARYALNLLQQARRNERAAAFKKRYAKLLATSVKPGINAGYLDPGLSVQRMKQRFEGESREVFHHRKRIAGLVHVKPGQAVADIGAGTGIYTWQFARAVGPKGRVYAVDIALPLVENLRKVAKNGGLDQVKAVQCGEKTCGLAANSVDRVFICDVYHHFEFPLETMRTIARAMRPGAELVLVDFERIPGKTRQWILGHVRAGRDVFRKEIESAGLVFVEKVDSPLKENYVLRFRKPE